MMQNIKILIRNIIVTALSLMLFSGTAVWSYSEKTKQEKQQFQSKRFKVQIPNTSLRLDKKKKIADIVVCCFYEICEV